MTAKKISIINKPLSDQKDDWVNMQVDAEPMKNINIPIPIWLHRKIKSLCAKRDVTVREDVTQLLIKAYGEQH